MQYALHFISFTVCPTACISHMTFKENKFVWSQHSVFDKLRLMPWVCGLSSFPASWKACGWLVWMVTKQQGVSGNSIPLGALQTFSPNFTEFHTELIQSTQILPKILRSRICLLQMAESFCKTLIVQLAIRVTDKVERFILSDFSTSSWLKRQGKHTVYSDNHKK